MMYKKRKFYKDLEKTKTSTKAIACKRQCQHYHEQKKKSNLVK